VENGADTAPRPIEESMCPYPRSNQR